MAYQNPKPELPDEPLVKLKKPESALPKYIQHDNVYFAFIDILGFKQAYNENREDSARIFTSEVKNVFQYFSLLMDRVKYKKQDQWNSGQFSDSLFFYTTRIDCLKAFIKLYSHFSLFSMSQNVFFRGGIAKGGLFTAKPYEFYGDGVIKAYLLESSLARYPRTMIDNSTSADLRREKDILEYIVFDKPPDRSYISPFATVPEEELLSILDIAPEELMILGKAEWNRIARNIQVNTKRFEFDDNNYKKYTFLQAAYRDSRQTNEKKVV